MAESILDVISGFSAEKRAALQTQAATNIAERNARAVTPSVTGASAPAPQNGVAVTDASAKAAPTLKATQIVDEEHGVIMMVGSLADAIDLDDDQVPASMMVKCAHDFTGRDNRVFNANHDNGEPIGAKLVESVTGVPILKSGRRLLAGEHIPAEDPVVAIGLVKAAGEATAWIVGVKPDDPAVVKAARDGKIVGASWGGMAQRTKATT